MVAVTGGSGRAGAYIIRELAEHERQVRNVDGFRFRHERTLTLLPDFRGAPRPEPAE